MIEGIDHIAVVVRDLEAAAEGYARLFGRAANWRGEMEGARQVWFQLGNMALDVISPVGPGATGEALRKRLDTAGEGIWALGFRVPDLAAAQKRCDRVGVPAHGPREEVTTHPDTGQTRRWTIAALGGRATHGVTLFLAEQTPDAPAWPVAPVAGETGEAAISGLDHVVVRTPDPDRAAALYGARLGLDMRLDRSNPDWGTRLMFFRCGDLVVEVAHDLKGGVSDGADSFWGLSWRAPDIAAAHDRMAAAGLSVSEIRTGRKPGTKVFTVRDAPGGVPTIVLGQAR